MSGGDLGITVYLPDAPIPGWYRGYYERGPCWYCGAGHIEFLHRIGARYPERNLELLHDCVPPDEGTHR